jgi:hypothetical protein
LRRDFLFAAGGKGRKGKQGEQTSLLADLEAQNKEIRKLQIFPGHSVREVQVVEPSQLEFEQCEQSTSAHPEYHIGLARVKWVKTAPTDRFGKVVANLIGAILLKTNAHEVGRTTLITLPHSHSLHPPPPPPHSIPSPSPSQVAKDNSVFSNTKRELDAIQYPAWLTVYSITSTVYNTPYNTRRGSR